MRPDFIFVIGNAASACANDAVKADKRGAAFAAEIGRVIKFLKLEWVNRSRNDAAERTVGVGDAAADENCQLVLRTDDEWLTDEEFVFGGVDLGFEMFAVAQV